AKLINSAPFFGMGFAGYVQFATDSSVRRKLCTIVLLLASQNVRLPRTCLRFGVQDPTGSRQLRLSKLRKQRRHSCWQLRVRCLKRQKAEICVVSQQMPVWGSPESLHEEFCRAVTTF